MPGHASTACIALNSEPDQELERLMKRNGYTRAEAESRIASQIPLEEKARLADMVLDNSRSLAELRAQVHPVLKKVGKPSRTT